VSNRRQVQPWRPLLTLPALLAALLASLLAAHALAGPTQPRVALTGAIRPRSLPRTDLAPVSVRIAGRVAAESGGVPPQLRSLRIAINSHGKLNPNGLPVCALRQIQPATTPRALSACRSSLVGQGTFSAYTVLRGQEPYRNSGRMLLFNGSQHGRSVLFGHIYLTRPFASSFVIPFKISSRHGGTYGTVLGADLVKALGTRRYLTSIEIAFSRRRYSFHGSRHSFLSASCPAPRGLGVVPFPLARATFSFAGHRPINSVLQSSCRPLG
jgi:hypothetical protein